MSKSFDFTPHLTEEVIERLSIESEEIFFYYENDRGAKRQLVTKYPDSSVLDESIFIEDDYQEWDPDFYNLKVSTRIAINNPSFIFMPLGAFDSNQSIGVAISWSCKDVNLRGVKKVGYIDFGSNDPISFDLELDFNKGTLRKELQVKVILYLQDAQYSGLVIAELSEHRIVIEGDGSVFPIVEVREPNYPLWWVDSSWIDPQEDDFNEENLKLCINSAHKNYKHVFKKDQNSATPIFIEIMASALLLIVLGVKETDYWNNIIKNQNNKHGSIGEAVYYFISTFDWDYSSPEALSKSIRVYLEENM